MNTPHVYAIEKDIQWQCEDCANMPARIGITIHTTTHRLCVRCALKLSVGIERIA